MGWHFGKPPVSISCTSHPALPACRLPAAPVCRAWVRGKGGVIVGDLPPYEAFPIGGTNSVRGYSEGAAPAWLVVGCLGLCRAGQRCGCCRS